MVFNRSVFKRMRATLAGLLLSVVVGILPAAATELPPGVVNYLKGRDPNVKIRFDGLVLFSNGESYVPVIPQDPGLKPDPQQVIMTFPEGRPNPDLIEFDNHFFLMRLIQTASGRLTFPRMEEYPIQLKEGLLPQDFVLPNNLFIPVELKVILGGLPYNPSYVPDPDNPMPPAQTVLRNTITPRRESAGSLYVFDLTHQRLVALNGNGQKINEVDLGCVPSSLKLSVDGKVLYAPCLTTDELAVVDVASGLVKTRVPVGQRPESVLYLPEREKILTSHRFSDFLSVVSATELLPGDKLMLPGAGGPMAMVPEAPVNRLVVASAFKPEVYVVNLERYAVEKTLKVPPNISALWVSPADGEQPPRLWLASRTQHQVTVMNLETGAVLQRFDVGEKPLDLVPYKDQLFVVCAGSARLDVLNWKTRMPLSTIQLVTGSFPSSMIMAEAQELAYVTAAGSELIYVVDLKSLQLDTAMTVDFRSSIAAIAGTVAMPAVRQPLKPLELPAALSTPQPPESPDDSAVVLEETAPRSLPDAAETRKAPTRSPEVEAVIRVSEPARPLPLVPVGSETPAPEAQQAAGKKPGKKWFGRGSKSEAPDLPPMMEALPDD